MASKTVQSAQVHLPLQGDSDFRISRCCSLVPLIHTFAYADMTELFMAYTSVSTLRPNALDGIPTEDPSPGPASLQSRFEDLLHGFVLSA